MSSQRLGVTITALTLSLFSPLQAEETSPRPTHILFFAPSHPRFLQLTPTVDNKQLAEVRKATNEKLRLLLDKNTDGFITREEWQDLATWGDRAPDQGTSDEWWKQVDTHPADGKLSPEEFEAIASFVTGNAFRLEFPPPRQTQAIDLFKFLDKNGDGLVSAEELAQGTATLNRYDLNEDGSVAIEELLPPDPGMPRAVTPSNIKAGTSDMWVIIPESDPAREPLIKRLLASYDRLPNGKPDGALDAAELGLTPQDLAPHDKNQNSRLEPPELQSLLAHPPAKVTIALQLSAREFRRPKMTLQGSDPKPAANNPAAGQILEIDAIPIEFNVRGARIAPSDARQFFRIKFRQADADKNQYLNEQEFLALQLPQANFKQVDRDHDGQLFDKELVAYLDQHLLITAGRLTAIITNDSKSLMEILDQDTDRRLSPREFRQSASVLKNFDQNHDGLLSPSELTVRQKIVFEYNRSPLLEVAANALNNPVAARSRTRQTLTGPVWFQRMDRNRDGDITLKEFLGPLETFEKLDLNHDGTIDEQEATQAK